MKATCHAVATSSTYEKPVLEAIDLEVGFEPGERIHTEDSHKYSPSEIDAAAEAARRNLERLDIAPE